MPTVHREGGFAFRIHLNDHEPAHVHAVLGGGTAIIALGDPDSAPYLWEFHHMKPGDVRRALDIARHRRALLLDAWERYHGD